MPSHATSLVLAYATAYSVSWSLCRQFGSMTLKIIASICDFLTLSLAVELWAKSSVRRRPRPAKQTRTPWKARPRVSRWTLAVVLIRSWPPMPDAVTRQAIQESPHESSKRRLPIVNPTFSDVLLVFRQCGRLAFPWLPSHRRNRASLDGSMMEHAGGTSRRTNALLPQSRPEQCHPARVTWLGEVLVF